MISSPVYKEEISFLTGWASLFQGPPLIIFVRLMTLIKSTVVLLLSKREEKKS